MTKRIFALAGVLAAFCSLSCRRPVDKGRLVRLVDALRLEDIRRSPFLDPQTAGLKALFTPLNSSPLSDEGSGPNPFDLKKKLYRAGIVINLLFAPPTSEYLINLGPGPGWSLDFGVGIIQDANSQKMRGGAPGVREHVTFEVILQDQGREKVVFNRSLPVPSVNLESHLALAEHHLVLPALPGPGRAVFRTRGAARAFAFWMNPVFYRRPRRPRNVILVSLDTLRADHLGCYGYGRPTSPALDGLAEESVLFKRAYAPSSWTLPSHVSMLTGWNTAHHRTVWPASRMDPAIVTLADTLRQAGFYCGAFTGGGFLSPRYGFAKGFDFYDELQGSFDHNDSAQRLAAVASRWLENRGDRSFFLFLHTYQIHDPFDTPPPTNRMFLEEGAEWDKLRAHEYFKDSLSFRPLSESQRQNIIGLYDAEIRYTDDTLVRRLVETLRRLGLFEQTLLILTSDHGEEFFEHQAWLHSRQLYEESIRVPLLIKFPSGRFRGRKVEGPVRLIDLMPTVLEEMGVGRGPTGMDGTSLLPDVRSGRAEGRIVLSELELDPKNTVKKCLIQGWDKIIRNDFTSERVLSNRFYPAPRRPGLELYRLADDPAERDNALDRKPELARKMADLLKTILAAFPPRLAHRIELDPALQERLRALGYVH